MDADREIEDAFRDAEEFHPLRKAEDDPLSSSSDDAIALRFADRHASDLRFVANWGQWLRHNGRQWRHDNTLLARDLARDVCRVCAEEFDYKTAVKIESAKTISAVESLARADRRLAATVDQWDADPWLLNTPDGVVDLKTGDLRPHRIEDFMTKITAVGPGGNCPLFLAFLNRIMNGNADLISYLQRVFGYGLTGEILEHALFFWYGTGANGKSVLLSTVSGLLGDYHTVAPIETFTVSNSDRHPTDLAGLVAGGDPLGDPALAHVRGFGEFRFADYGQGDDSELRGPDLLRTEPDLLRTEKARKSAEKLDSGRFCLGAPQFLLRTKVRQKLLETWGSRPVDTGTPLGRTQRGSLRSPEARRRQLPYVGPWSATRAPSSLRWSAHAYAFERAVLARPRARPKRGLQRGVAAWRYRGDDGGALHGNSHRRPAARVLCTYGDHGLSEGRLQTIAPCHPPPADGPPGRSSGRSRT